MTFHRWALAGVWGCLLSTSLIAQQKNPEKLRILAPEKVADAKPTDLSSWDFTPDGKALVYLFGGSVQVLDTESGKPIRSWSQAGRAWRLSLSPDGKDLLLLEGLLEEWKLTRWALESGRLQATVSLPKNFPKGAPLLPEMMEYGADRGSLLVAAGGPLIALDPETLRVKDWLSLEGDQVRFFPDGKSLAVAQALNTWKVVDLKSGKSPFPARKHGVVIKRLEVMSGGKSILTLASLESGKLEKSLKVWDAKSGKELRSFKPGDPFHIAKIAVARQRNDLVVVFSTSGREAKATFWNPETGEDLWSALALPADCDVTLSPVGDLMAVRENRAMGEVSLWSLPRTPAEK